MPELSNEPRPARLPDLSQFDAVLFDLDGVITPTAALHMRAWRELFTEYFREVDVAPYEEDDYYEHLDGLQRYDGVAKLLASREIELPRGEPSDPPDAETACGLGNRKNIIFSKLLEGGVTPFEGAVALLDALEAAGVEVALVSSSKNAHAVLEAAGLADRFLVRVTGVEAEERALASKPAPDSFLAAAAELGVQSAHAVVVEDALSGVEAGRRGGFGLVVGVGAPEQAEGLLAAGADLVVEELSPLARVVADNGMDRNRYPVSEWSLVELIPPRGVDGAAETLFSLGNGYLGVRGNPSEGGSAYENGTFINGLHETFPIRYPEAGYAFAETGQTVLNAPDAKTVRVRVNGELVSASGGVEEYRRELDLRRGVLTREFVYTTTGGARVRLTEERAVSFKRRNLALFTTDVKALSSSVRVEFESFLINRQDGEGELAGKREVSGFDPRRADELGGRALEPAAQLNEGNAVGLAFRTVNSGMAVAVVADHEPPGRSTIAGGASGGVTSGVAGDVAITHHEVELPAGGSARFSKRALWLDGAAEDAGELLAAARAELGAAPPAGELLAEQRAWLGAFWEDADVELAGQPALQQAARFNLFQLAQAAARADGRGVSAKGVSGSGYSGHYFWDTEIYVLPFLSYVLPRAARGALELRHALLPAARRRARAMSVKGALYPWRTISGEEASAYYPAGTAQYHINADVAYALLRYAAVTGDEEFLAGPGSEILIETARMWRSLGFFSPNTGRFHIHSVTGPDEYSAVVNDNYYTNAMAQLNLEAAADAAERRPELLGVTREEISSWREAARSMAFPRDERLGVNAQDAEFLSRQRWDLSATPREKRPLLLHYHPLVIYRHQVLKQPDLVLAHYLLSGRFSAEEKRRDFEYYDPLTTGDSTLSAGVQAIMAAEVGLERRAFRLFRRLLFTDLADLHANTADGIHVAAMGSTWLAAVAGFAGLRDDGGRLRFDPRPPAALSGVRFKLRWRGSRLSVALRRGSLELKLLEGPAVKLMVRGEEHLLTDALAVSL